MNRKHSYMKLTEVRKLRDQESKGSTSFRFHDFYFWKKLTRKWKWSCVGLTIITFTFLLITYSRISFKNVYHVTFGGVRMGKDCGLGLMLSYFHFHLCVWERERRNKNETTNDDADDDDYGWWLNICILNNTLCKLVVKRIPENKKIQRKSSIEWQSCNVTLIKGKNKNS